VIVAMANYQAPRVPELARELDPAIRQLHSSGYSNPGQLKEGGVLIVGAGNSGAEIAIELAPRRKTRLSGPEVGHLPFRMDGFLGRHLLSRLVLGLAFNHILTTGTPIGRRARLKALHRPVPLIRVKPRDLIAAGVERVARTTGIRDGRPMLATGETLDVANVVWCTGYHPAFDWIELPVFGENGEPRHERGVVGGEPGLYFLGLHFLYAMSSPMIQGVGRDARYIAGRIAARCRVHAESGIEAAA
jgi:putative flavoprotein involved in K+ transport